MTELGKNGPTVSRLGLGCMGMSGAYGAADDAESGATIRAALDAGITLLDTGDFYGSGHNEMLIGRAVAERDREGFLLSVKFGGLRGPDGEYGGFDGRPVAVRNFLAYSLRRLGTDYIDIYRPARLDPHVPIEETIGAIAEQVGRGHVRYVGLSEVGAETVRRAAAVHPICDLQIEYSLLSRGIETEILPTCRDLGIGITAYGVLSRGLISDALPPTFTSTDFRAHSPRFQGDNLTHNRGLVDALAQIARTKDVSVAQLAIAWVLTRGEDIVPLIGTRRGDRLADSLGALDIVLTEDELVTIERAVPPGAAAGERYNPAGMASLDSEK
jgi:aryl-alcohol dehydrogenase-like predicted oxidoreductase